jgi:Selenocysteine lyase
VLDAMREFYEHSYANVHRGVYTLAERATAGYEGAREKVRATSTRRRTAR